MDNEESQWIWQWLQVAGIAIPKECSIISMGYEPNLNIPLMDCIPSSHPPNKIEAKAIAEYSAIFMAKPPQSDCSFYE